LTGGREIVHGIQRTREMRGSPGSQGGLTKITVSYSDERVLTFVPDAGREAFSEDDLLEFKKVLERASSAAEWADISTRLDS
jgi:hypothetical protein